LPFSTSTSVDASLHMLCGGRQSSRFTSAIVPLAGASTTNARVPSPRELRTVTLMASGATTGGVLLAVGEGGCIQQLRSDFRRSEGGPGEGESTRCNQGVLDFDGGRRYMEEVETAAAAAAMQAAMASCPRCKQQTLGNATTAHAARPSRRRFCLTCLKESRRKCWGCGRGGAVFGTDFV